MMKSIVTLSLLVLPLLVAPMASASPFAASNGNAKGNFSESRTITNRTISDNTMLVTTTVTTTFSGGMVGMAVFSESETVYLNGSTTFKASGTFVGRVLGSAPGAYHETYSGTGMGATFQGQGEDRDGRGGLAGFLGFESFHGTYTSKTTATGSYSLMAHFS